MQQKQVNSLGMQSLNYQIQLSLFHDHYVAYTDPTKNIQFRTMHICYICDAEEQQEKLCTFHTTMGTIFATKVHYKQHNVLLAIQFENSLQSFRIVDLGLMYYLTEPYKACCMQTESERSST